MKKRKIYEEQYKTIVLFTRLNFFPLSINFESESDKVLSRRIMQIICKKNLIRHSYDGFLGPRRQSKWTKLAKYAVKFGFSTVCPIYNIPGFYTQDNANPCKIYQKWCQAFDGQFTTDELAYIEKTSIENGDELRYLADRTWLNMKIQHEWTWLKELNHLISFWTSKLSKNSKNCSFVTL